MPRWLALALLLLLGMLPTAAAQGLANGPGDSADSVLGPPPGTLWRHGRERWFVASRVDAGFFFLRPRVSMGYGQPHFSWWGVDTVPIVSTSAAGGYAGLRIERPLFELRSGALFQYSFNRSYLPHEENYSKRDIDILNGPRAQYWLWDSQLEIYIPLGHLKLRAETQPIIAFGFPDGYDVYLDTMWVVIGSGLTLRERLGVEYFMRGTNIGVTPTVEVIWLDQRSQAVVRAGVQLRWLLSDDVQVRTSILPAVSSPDFLGRAGADMFEVSFRWLWATDAK